MWCNFCKEKVETEADLSNGFTCCTICGRVLDDSVFSSEPTFLRTPTGVSQVEGNVVPNTGIAPTLTRGPRGTVTISFQSQDSHEKTLNKGKAEIHELADRLSIRPREDIAAAAHRLYKLAVQRNFTRGRRTQQVAAACLYTICRQEQKPYMLIDFSDCIQVNVYLLGAVFLQLIQLMRLESNHIISRPIDPSLFIHRFADRMNLGKSMHTVANTALRLVASMKRDWMQTGRRPAGICGAALFIACHMHGFQRKKKDIVNVVHVNVRTIMKRLGEFESTPNAQLTSKEFEEWGVKYEKDQVAAREQPQILSVMKGVKHDLSDIIKLCGGFVGGEDPPCFSKEETPKLTNGDSTAQIEYNQAKEIVQELDTALETKSQNAVDSDGLEEIDDDEIDQYMHSNAEADFKEKLWKQMNQEYLLSLPQKAKTPASQDSQAATQSSTAAESSKEGTKGKKRKHGSSPYSAETASEATHKMLSSKRLSSKVNYSVLQDLFGEGPSKQAEDGNTKDKDKESTDKADFDDSRFMGSGLGLNLGDTLRMKTRKKVQFAE